MEREDEFGELVVINAGLHLAAEQVAGGLGERCFVDGVNGLMEWLDVEEGVLDVGGVVLEVLDGLTWSEIRRTPRLQVYRQLPMS